MACRGVTKPREKIAITVAPDLLAQVERLRRKSGESRSAVFERALVSYLGGADRSANALRHAEGYRKLPETPADECNALIAAVDVHAVRALVTVAPVTTRVRGIPTEVALGKHEALPRPCVANLDALTTIPKRTLEQYAGTLSPAKSAALDEAIRFALGLEVL